MKITKHTQFKEKTFNEQKLKPDIAMTAREYTI